MRRTDLPSVISRPKSVNGSCDQVEWYSAGFKLRRPCAGGSVVADRMGSPNLTHHCVIHSTPFSFDGAIIVYRVMMITRSRSHLRFLINDHRPYERTSIFSYYLSHRGDIYAATLANISSLGFRVRSDYGGTSDYPVAGCLRAYSIFRQGCVVSPSQVWTRGCEPGYSRGDRVHFIDC